MEIADDLICVFSAQPTDEGDQVVIRIPEQEIELGSVSPESTYRVAILEPPTQEEPGAEREPQQSQTQPEPPVEEGEELDVEIEGIGDQGDGIARVERGFVVIVPDTEKGERVTVEIVDVRPSVAFAEVVERHHPKIE